MSDSLYVNLGVMMKDFNQKIDKALSRLDEFGDKAIKVGGAMSIGISAPLGILYNKMLNLYDIQASALAQVETGLRSTGYAAGFTSDQLAKIASVLQNNSLFGDEKILQDVTAQLLTFTNIAGDEFARTQQAALDLATRLDGDLKGASIQLGKALNDPVANLSALGRSGIQFSKDQQDVIKALAESGRLAEAQGIILSELEKQYGGSAKAAAEAGTGWRTQLGNILGDVQESFGEIISDSLKPFGDILKKIAIRILELSPAAKKTILVISGIAFAIGPLLVGIGTMVKLLPIVKAGLLAMRAAVLGVSWPVLAITAAIVGLAAAFVYVRDNLQAFKERFLNIFNTIRNKVIDIIKGIAYPYIKLAELLGMDIAKGAISFFDSLKGSINEATTEFGTFGRAMNNALKDLGLFSDQVDDKKLPIIVDVEEVEEEDIVTGLGRKIDTSKSGFSEMEVDQIIGVSAIRDGKVRMIDELAKLADIDYKGVADKMKEKMSNTIQSVPIVMGEMSLKITQDLVTIQEGIKEAIDVTFNSLGDTLSLGFQSMFDPQVNFKDGFKRILGQFLSALGDMVMKMALKLEAVAALKTKVEAALAGIGTGGIALVGAAALFGLGAALKGGGAAIANSNISGSIGGGSNNAPSYNPRGGDQRIVVEFANGAFESKMAYDQARNGI